MVFGLPSCSYEKMKFSTDAETNGIWRKRLIACAVWAVLVPAPAAWAQSGWGQAVISPLDSALSSHGFHLYSAGIQASYYSNGTDMNTSQAGTLQDDAAAGASLSAGWSQNRDRWGASVVYTGSYLGRVRYSSWDAFNQSLSFTAAHKMGMRWSASVGGSAAVTNLAQFFFEPNADARITAIPTTFEDLSAALLTGQTTNADLAAFLTGAPLLQSPAAVLLYGTRFFNTSVQGTLTYAHSSRTSVSFTASGSRFQHLSDNGPAPATYLLPKTMSAGGSVQLSHALTPRTKMTASGTVTRIYSGLQDAYTSSGSVGLGRTMSQRWFVQGQVGIAKVQSLRATYRLNQGPQYVAGGTIGFKSHSHTMTASYNRSITDVYGLGASSMQTGSGSWQWARPGRSWWLFAQGDRQLLVGSAFSSGGLNTWRVSGGWGRRISRSLVLQTQYAYMQYSGTFAGTSYDRSGSAIQVSLSWAPQREASGQGQTRGISRSEMRYKELKHDDFGRRVWR